MAPPFRWFDSFCDAGWPAALTPAALRLVLAVGRRVDRHTRQTRVSLSRLQDEVRLPSRSFWRAKTELARYGLLHCSKLKGKWTITLVAPVPEVPPTAESTATPGSKNCHQWQKRLPSVAETTRQKPTRTWVSAADRQQTKAQLEEQTEAQIRTALVVSLSRYLGSDDGWLLEELVAASLAVAAAPGSLGDQAHLLSRRLQANNVLAPEDAVREALQDAAAIAAAATTGCARAADPGLNGGPADA